MNKPRHQTLPLCALLIPHYRNIAGLARSLASIGQDECIDVFIVDDGSGLLIDEVALGKVFLAQGSLYFIYLSENQGIAHALNVGLARIGQQYKYIARLDCGDLCAPDRFKRQMAFLDQYLDIALVGTAVTFVNQQGKPQYTLRLPENAAHIRQAMHLNCAFIHPTVMWRASMAEKVGRYPLHYPMAEDFAFFWLFVQQFNTANLSDVLVWAEVNPAGLSLRKRQQQLRSRLRLQWRYFDGRIRACYGILKTLLLMLLPYQWILIVKQIRDKA
jgi:glycosyltransferase involved in cell wall biosynthesis